MSMDLTTEQRKELDDRILNHTIKLMEKAAELNCSRVKMGGIEIDMGFPRLAPLDGKDFESKLMQLPADFMKKQQDPLDDDEVLYDASR